MNKWLKRLLIALAVIGLICLIVIAYFKIAFEMKYRGIPFDETKVAALNNWPMTELTLDLEDMDDFGDTKELDGVIFDLIHNGTAYAMPSIPTGDETSSHLAMTRLDNDSVKKEIFNPVEDTAIRSDFNEHEIQNYNTPNRVFNLDKNIMIYHLGRFIYSVDLDTFETKVLEEFDSDVDYTRRLAYLWYDGEKLYYILNKFDKESGSYDVGDPTLVIKDLKNNERETMDLYSLATSMDVEPYSDFIHNFYPFDGPNIYFTRKENDIDQLWAYHVEDGTTQTILARPDYYYGTEGGVFSDEFFIEHSLYTTRYGIRIFDRKDNRILNTIVGKDRYGNFNHTRIFENRYAIADRPLLYLDNDIAMRDSFYLLDLKEKKTYKLTLVLEEGEKARLLGIDEDKLYIEKMNNNHKIKLKIMGISKILEQ